MGTVEHRQAIPITGHGLAVNQARRSLERERGARDQGEAAPEDSLKRASASRPSGEYQRRESYSKKSAV